MIGSNLIAPLDDDYTTSLLEMAEDAPVGIEGVCFSQLISVSDWNNCTDTSVDRIMEMMEQGKADEEYARSLMEAEMVMASPARNMVGLTEDEEYARNLDAQDSLQEKQDAELARMMQQVLVLLPCSLSDTTDIFWVLNMWPLIFCFTFSGTGRSFLIIQ